MMLMVGEREDVEHEHGGQAEVEVPFSLFLDWHG